MGILFLRIAGIYFVIGFLFLMGFEIAGQFQYSILSEHINMYGWASMVMVGIIYYLFPTAGKSMLAKVHFWLHNIGLPIFLVTHFLEVARETNGLQIGEVGPFISVGAITTLIGIILFVINVLINVRVKSYGVTLEEREHNKSSFI